MDLELRGDGFIIRECRMSDLPALVKYADNYNVWVNLGDQFPRPYTEEAGREWLQGQLNGTDEFTTFAIVVDDEFCGNIGYRVRDAVWRKTAGLGYWLGEPFWGRGIMTEAVKLITEYAFDHEDIVRVQASVYEWNPASGRVLEKAGYTLEGRLRDAIYKDGRIGDELIYGILKSRRR